MNPELPKSIRNGLAQQKAATSHPSADLLTAFVEHALTQGESLRVANHLAGCQECREVLFLASSTQEDFTARLKPAARAAWRPRPRWVTNIAKTLFAVSGLIIVAGIFLRIHVEHQNAEPGIAQVAQSPQRPALRVLKPETSSPQTATANVGKPIPPPKAKPSEAGKVPHQASEVAATRAAPVSPPASSDTAAVAQDAPVNPQPVTVTAGSANSLKVAAPQQNAFAEPPSQGGPAQAFISTKPRNDALAFLRPNAASETWRITPQGQLEHLSDTGWIPMLADQPAKFRAVSESPNGVWVGGSSGEVFHSRDGGAHWTKIALPVPSNGKNDAIVVIKFVDLKNGIIVTESGVRYTSSDGGQKWQNE